MTHHVLAAASSSGSGGGGGFPLIFLLILAVAAFWFMTRSSRRNQKAQQEARNNLEVGDDVMTGSGLFGTVVDVEGDVVTLETEPGGARTRWLRQAIAKKIEPSVADEVEADQDEPADVDDIEVPDDLSSMPNLRKDDEPDTK